MAHPNQENQENQEEQNPTQELDSGGNETETQEEESPIPVWQSALYESNAARTRAEEEARLLREQLAAARATPPAPIPQETLSEGDVFSNPERFRQLLSQDVANQVAPINQFAKDIKRKEDYALLKMRMKAFYPQFTAVFNQIEPKLDATFYSDPNLQATEGTLTNLIKSIMGELYLASLANPNNNRTQTPNQERDPVLPPNVRPSTRVNRQTESPTDNPYTQRIANATENERRLARESKLSLAEYFEIQDAPPHEAAKVWKGIKDRRKGGK